MLVDSGSGTIRQANGMVSDFELQDTIQEAVRPTFHTLRRITPAFVRLTGYCNSSLDKVPNITQDVDNCPDRCPHNRIICGMGNFRYRSARKLCTNEEGKGVSFRRSGTTLCKARSRMDDAIFQFSVEEKAQFIKDFLEELEIPKVDMLVTNGCSVYTGLNLCLHNPDLFKSLSLINPTGIRPTKSMMPNYFTVSVVHVWEEQMHVRLLLMPYVWIGKLFTPNRHLGNKELVTFSRSAFRISYKNVQMAAREYRARGLQTFVVYSDTCPDLDIQATEDLLTLAGIPGSAIVALNENDEIVKEGAANGTSTGLLFKGHVGDIKKSKAPTIRKHLIKFFKTVRPDV